MSPGIKKEESPSPTPLADHSVELNNATTPPSSSSASTSVAAAAPRRSSRPRAPRQLEDDMVALPPLTRRKRARNEDGNNGINDLDRHDNDNHADSAPPTNISPSPAKTTYVEHDPDVPDNVQAFYEKFFELSDDPTAHDEYAAQFYESCKFRVGAMQTVKTPSEIRSWRVKAWEAPIAWRCHRINKVFLYNNDYKDRVMLRGHVLVGMQDGTETKIDFAAYLYYSPHWRIDDSGSGCTIDEYIVWEAPGQDDEDEDE